MGPLEPLLHADYFLTGRSVPVTWRRHLEGRRIE